MKYIIDPKEIRVYNKTNSCIFKKNNDEFGGLSNMATGFPLKVNGIEIKTSEALYQACRFPYMPEIQHKIIEEKSPMTVKMISRANLKKSREDWDTVKIKVMKWCISVKLAQNFVKFGALLHQTGLKNIVENSSKDNFWGAIPDKDELVFTGKNALGRLLMDLRQSFFSEDNYSLFYVEPPKIENFLLYNEPIGIIDERTTFIYWLQNYWELKFSNNFKINSNNSTQKLQMNLQNQIQNGNILYLEERNENVVKNTLALNDKKVLKKSRKKENPQTILFNSI